MYQLLNGKGHLWIYDHRILGYQVMLKENPQFPVGHSTLLLSYPCKKSLSPSLFPRDHRPLGKAQRGIIRRCYDQSWGNLWAVDRSSFILDGKRRERYAIVYFHEAKEAKLLPPGTSAQLAEALTQALELGKGKRLAIYTDSKYAFLVLHAHLERKGSPDLNQVWWPNP